MTEKTTSPRTTEPHAADAAPEPGTTDATPDSAAQSAPESAAQSAPAPQHQPRSADASNPGNASDAWSLYEVFIRPRRGVNHSHVGSIHAPDSQMALRNARDLYTRRQEGVSIWVVASNDITANSPDEKDSFFDPAADKIYRHPTFYDVPEGVQM